MLFKFELTCHQNTDICVSLGSKAGEARMYIY